jgi:siderophore synthetase component
MSALRSTVDIENTGSWSDSLLSPHYISVRRRIIRQLIESLVYEGVLPKSSIVNSKISIQGQDSDGNKVRYIGTILKMYSFEKVHLKSEAIVRVAHDNESELTSISLFLNEITNTIGAEETLVKRTVNELKQTLLKDTLAQDHWSQQSGNLRDLPYDKVEAGVIDGHPYHPCYKSRIGFDIEDNFRYGPEFEQSIKPIWLAAHVSVCDFHVPQKKTRSQWWKSILGNHRYNEYINALSEKNVSIEEYGFIPVHPWQFKRIVSLEFSREFENLNLIYMGVTDSSYYAQQSIRTLANLNNPKSDYFKLSLSIQNTSTSRILAPHTVANAPIISNWLQGIHENDTYLKDDLKTILLGEMSGAAYHFKESKPGIGYGALSCIWRESLHAYLHQDEQAIPFSGLTKIDRDGKPLIENWVNKHGIQDFLHGVLSCSISPLIHYLYKYGIALESHAQNMILVHRDGLATRVALKDFHDGVRFSPSHLPKNISPPQLVSTPSDHLMVNRNSFIEVSNPHAARDFMLDAFMFINLAEIAKFMFINYNFSEKTFWEMAANIINQYRSSFPQQQDRYALYDLNIKNISVEQLTKRRLFPDDGPREHLVKNPLSGLIKI